MGKQNGMCIKGLTLRNHQLEERWANLPLQPGHFFSNTFSSLAQPEAWLGSSFCPPPVLQNRLPSASAVDYSQQDMQLIKMK